MNPSTMISSGWRRARWWGGVAWLLAGLLPAGRAAAQEDPGPPQRWLLIFDTSIAMERWLPGTTTEVQNLFFDSMSGQLHAGDSIGVWTFSDKLRAGRYPLFLWEPGKAADASSRLTGFLDYEHYAGQTRFAALVKPLKAIIAKSRRLTIVIFCDGQDQLQLTPYDAGINRAFSVMQDDRKRVKDPFALVIRTQNGAFVGATVNLPPGSLDLPPFPRLPPPPAPVNTNHAAPPLAAPPLPAPVAPLVIVGTNVVTNPVPVK